MIIDMFLLVLQGVLALLLSPLAVVNVSIDFLGNVPIVKEFLQLVAYILPWRNLLPLITLLIGLFVFRIAVALISKIKDVVPFF